MSISVFLMALSPYNYILRENAVLLWFFRKNIEKKQLFYLFVGQYIGNGLG
jgi:hypothetical protein